METEFKTIEGRSAQFYLLILVLAALVSAGVFVTYLMHERGIYLSGMTNRIPWGLQIVLAVFYIGLSAGSLVISSLYGVFGKLEYKPFARIAVYLAMLLLIGALLSILTDQGRIDRVLIEPFAHLNPLSMFSINPFLYISYVLICMVYLWALLNENERFTKVMALTAVIWAIGVHSGTGAIFGFVPRELYQSPLLPPSFAAALSSGTALMILVIVLLFRLTKRPLDNRLVMWPGHLLAVFVVVVMYFLFIENAYRFYVHESREAARYFLFGGFHSALFWGGLILFGFHSSRRHTVQAKNREFNPLDYVFRRLGRDWRSLREVSYCYSGSDLSTGSIAGYGNYPFRLEEGIAIYSISLYEVLQALGVVSLIGLLYALGLKYLRLLPTEAKIYEQPASTEAQVV